MTDTACRILVIDDSPADQALVTDLLCHEDPGFEVRTAFTQAQALSVIDAWDVDCVLVDYWLETETGTELMQSIRKVDPFCPVIMLTGNGSEKTAAAAIKGGAFEYLGKSELSRASLVTAIRNAVALAAHNRDLARKDDEMKRASRLDALGELAGGLAHDFNNLLTTAHYAITLGLKDASSGPARAHLNNALDSLSRGARLTERLRTFAAHQGGEARPRRIGDVLANFAAFAVPALGERIRIETSADDPEATVVCDQFQLDQALFNLALNARDAIFEGRGSGRVALSVASTLAAVEGPMGPFVEFTLTDDGSGMTRNVHERATDPYFTTRRRGPGTGLGLSMVYGFVQQSGGELRIETARGTGTSVTMRLKPGRRAPAMAARLPPPQPCRIDARPRRPRILLVDDELLLLMEAALIIRDFGYDVMEASSGAEALTMIDPQRPVDLLLTDVHMPGMDGFTLANAARSKQPCLKVLYFSGYTGFTETDMGDVPAPVVSKPCSPRELENRLREILQTPAAHLPPSPAAVEGPAASH